MRPRLLLLSLILASFAVGYIVLVRQVFVPLHESGRAQGVTSVLCGLGHLLELPGVLAATGTSMRAKASSGAPWVRALAFNGCLYFAIAALFTGALRRARPSPATSPPEADGSAYSRRGFLRAGAALVAAGGGGAFVYGFFVEPRWIRTQQRVFPVRGLPRELDGLRMVQLTDVHLGPWISLAYVQAAVNICNSLDPDIVLLTGDYVHRSPVYFEPVAGALARLRARIGRFAVLGNHDWWEGVTPARGCLHRVGIPTIDNGRVFITPDRRIETVAAGGLCIAGVGDLWEDVVDFEKALGGVPSETPRLLLSHNPDVAEERALIEGGYRVDLMIAGHTHGGQVRLPFLGTPIVPSRFGSKYAEGLVAGPVCPVFICRGVGMTVLPVRWGAPPEIALIQLKAS